MKQKPTDAQIQNEANNGLKNAHYTLAMARTNAPHSATAQFFINTTNNGFLDFKSESPSGWGYAVFGKVIEGQDVVDKIEKVKTGHAQWPWRCAGRRRGHRESRRSLIHTLTAPAVAAGRPAVRPAPRAGHAGQRTARLERHLAETPAQAVLLLGDIFEVWVGDDARHEPFEAGVVRLLREASAGG